MKNLSIYLTAIIVVLGAYVYTFGVPTSLDPRVNSNSSEAAVTPNPRRPSGGGRRGNRTSSVVLGEIKQESYTDILRAIGTGEAIKSVEVVSDVVGQVQEKSIVSNSNVKAGDVLLKLDSQNQTINLKIAETNLAQAQEVVDRYEKLGASGTSALAEVTIKDARSALIQAQLQVNLAEIALAERTIVAPIDGTLSLSDVNTGANISVGNTIVTIDDIHEILVTFELPERALSLLSQNREVLLSTPVVRGKVFKGKIFAFDNRVDSITRTITVQARVDNAERLLLPGMSFAVRIINQIEPGSVVPTNAITWTANGSEIWVVENDVANSVSTTIVMRQGDQIWIDAKLEAGTKIVVEGAQKLRNGSKVSALNAEANTRSPNARNPNGRAPNGRTPKQDGAKPDASKARPLVQLNDGATQ